MTLNYIQFLISSDEFEANVLVVWKQRTEKEEETVFKHDAIRIFLSRLREEKGRRSGRRKSWNQE